jgi:hypothetical protein
MRWLVRRRDRPIFAPPPTRWRWLLAMVGVLALVVVVLLVAAIVIAAIVA